MFVLVYVDDIIVTGNKNKQWLTDSHPTKVHQGATKEGKHGRMHFLPHPIALHSQVISLWSVHKLAQFVQTPLECHWRMVKRVLGYLSETASYGLSLKKENSMAITAYSDSDWAGDPDDRKFTSGHCVFLGSNLVSWASRK
ncbi:putative mitochondrial protein [Arachis hypogaea]|nr:putative mitochondrial protein [Arachis hypogaea]